MWNVGFFENFWVILYKVLHDGNTTAFFFLCAINLAIGWFGYRPITGMPITAGRYIYWFCFVSWIFQMWVNPTIFGQASLILLALGFISHLFWDVIYQGALERY